MIEEYKPAIKQGVIMGIVGIVIFLITYAIDPLFFAKPTGWFVMIAVNFLALPIAFLILGAKACKSKFKNFSFGNAFNAAFFTGITAAIVSLLFNLAFMYVIDPTWEVEMAQEVLNSTEAFMEKMGAPQETIDKAMDDARAKDADKAKGIMGQLQGTGISLVWYALIALIVAAVQRTKKTELEDEVQEIGN